MGCQDPAAEQDSTMVDMGMSGFVPDFAYSPGFWMSIAFVVVMAMVLFGLRDLDDTKRQERIRAKARKAATRWQGKVTT
jgi:hypothetical protein